MTSILPAPRDAPLPRRVLQSLLGGGLAYLLLFAGTHSFIAATSTMGFGPLAILVLAVITTAETVLMLRRDRRISDAVTVVVSVALLAATGAGSTLLPHTAGDLGYAAWVFGAVTFVLLALTVAGRFVTAWLTLAGVATIAMVWSSVNGFGWLNGAELIVRHVATLIVGTALAMSLRRSTAAQEEFRAIERRRRSEEHAAHARAAARRGAAQDVLTQAGPMLQAIADGRPLTDDDRVQLLVLEGALRDQIRTPRLVAGPLLAAVAGARQRGVNVLLLDEADDVPDELREQAALWLAEEVGVAVGGRFVGRLRMTDGQLKVTAVTDEGSATRSFEAAAGTV